jgi:hypothetical protein
MRALILVSMLLAILLSVNVACGQDISPRPPLPPQMNCQTAEQLEEPLRKGYGEFPALTLLSRGNYLLKFFLNNRTGTWSAIRIAPNGCAAPLDGGDYALFHDDLNGPES